MKLVRGESFLCPSPFRCKSLPSIHCAAFVACVASSGPSHSRTCQCDQVRRDNCSCSPVEGVSAVQFQGALLCQETLPQGLGTNSGLYKFVS